MCIRDRFGCEGMIILVYYESGNKKKAFVRMDMAIIFSVMFFRYINFKFSVIGVQIEDCIHIVGPIIYTFYTGMILLGIGQITTDLYKSINVNHYRKNKNMLKGRKADSERIELRKEIERLKALSSQSDDKHRNEYLRIKEHNERLKKEIHTEKSNKAKQDLQLKRANLEIDLRNVRARGGKGMTLKIEDLQNSIEDIERKIEMSDHIDIESDLLKMV